MARVMKAIGDKESVMAGVSINLQLEEDTLVFTRMESSMGSEYMNTLMGMFLRVIMKMIRKMGMGSHFLLMGVYKWDIILTITIFPMMNNNI